MLLVLYLVFSVIYPNREYRCEYCSVACPMHSTAYANGCTHMAFDAYAAIANAHRRYGCKVKYLFKNVSLRACACAWLWYRAFYLQPQSCNPDVHPHIYVHHWSMRESARTCARTCADVHLRGCIRMASSMRVMLCASAYTRAHRYKRPH